MVNNAPTLSSEIHQERTDDTSQAWIEAQESLAVASGLSLLLVDGHQPPALVVSNNNSICQAIQSSTQFGKLCDPYCGDAHRQAMSAKATIEYKCHAGLQCFTQPVTIGGKDNYAVIGGRAFLTGPDYQAFTERVRHGDLQDLAVDELFSNIVFSDRERLLDLSTRVLKIARQLPQRGANSSEVNSSVWTARKQDLELEVERLRDELEYRSMVSTSLQHFLERISSDDPGKTYQAILSHSKELLCSERASLFVFDETSNELILKAAVGLPTADTVSHLRAGEGISGEVIERGTALMVADMEIEGLTPAPADRLYKTKSFISYPISIRGRKIGLLNITDKSGGGAYDDVDLSLLEIIEPQVALALERAEWQERATEYQLMSITDALTGLRNRRYLEERLTEELNRSKRYDYPMSFLMIDIDDFKTYNDGSGHQAGDLALQLTANCLKGALRSADVAARYGGEEFCILLPQTSIDEAGTTAERIQQHVAATHFPHGKSQPLGRVTLSIGVSTFSPVLNTAETVIAAADRALYRAKSLGKDRIEFYYDEGRETTSPNERQ